MAERKKLGELLLEAKVINAIQLQSAIAHQRQWGSKLGTALMEKGFVDEETLVKFLSQQRGMPGVVLSKTKIPPDVLKRIPRELQEKHSLVPVSIEKLGNRETLTVAMADPSNLQALDEIKFAIGGVRIKTVIAVEATIKKAISGDSRQFRPSLGPPPGESAKPEITDEFAVVRGTMEQTVITSGSTPVIPTSSGTAAPASASRTPARGVDSAPVGEAVLELDVDPEISEIEAVQLDASDFEPIVTNVGPAPVAPAPVAPPMPPPAVPDPFLDALRGPPRQPNGGAAAAAAVQPMPVPPPVAPAFASPVALPAREPIPGVSPFATPQEERTERDIPMVAPAPPPIAVPFPATPTPAPFPVGDPFAPNPGAPPWSSASSADPWAEPSAESSFEPLAEAPPWPPAAGNSAASAEYADTVPGPLPDAGGGLTDLGPGAVPVLSSGASPLEGSVPEISLPGPEMPEGATWDPQARVGAFDPDTAPETDLGAAAGPGVFSIPSELEVQEGSMPGVPIGNAPSPPVAEAPPMEPPDPAFEATAADEPMTDYVEPGFETAVSAPPPPPADSLPPEMPVDTLAGDPGKPVGADLTMPEYEPTSPEPPPPGPEPPPAMTSSTAGMIPSMTAQGSQDHAEATAIGSGHHEPTWDAPMEFTAPPEGSVVSAPEVPPPPAVEPLRAREMEEERSSVTRESPFPMGTEPARGAVMLSPLHVEEPPPPPEIAPPPEPAPEPEPEADHEPTVFSAPEPPPEVPPPPEVLAPPREVTPPTKQSEVVSPPPTVRIPGEAAPPPPPPAEREPTPHAVSSTGPVAAATSDEQAALNTLVSKKLKLLNAITEILLEKGLITEDEIREKIAKKK